MQRRNVVLPEPDGPMMHAAQDVVRAEILLDAGGSDDHLAEVTRLLGTAFVARGPSGWLRVAVRNCLVGHRSLRAIRRSRRCCNWLKAMVRIQ